MWALPFLLAGVGSFVYIIFHGIKTATDSLVQIVVPGDAELNLHPSTYTVFVEEQSVLNGKVYSTPSVTGITCHLSSIDTGTVIKFTNPAMSTTYSYYGRSGHSVLEFPIERDGKYKFSCAYEEGAKGPDGVVAVGAGVAGKISRTVFGGLASLFGGIGAAVTVIFIIGSRRRRARMRQWHAGQMPLR